MARRTAPVLDLSRLNTPQRQAIVLQHGDCSSFGDAARGTQPKYRRSTSRSREGEIGLGR